VVVEYYSLLALERSPLIVFPDLVCCSEAAAEAMASLETVVTVSWFVEVSAGTEDVGAVGSDDAGAVVSVDAGAVGSADVGAVGSVEAGAVGSVEAGAVGSV